MTEISEDNFMKTETIPIQTSELVIGYSHVFGIANYNKLDTENLDNYEIYDIDINYKKGLLKSVTKLATILDERHSYTIDIDPLHEHLWNLSKTRFVDEHLTVYYANFAVPLIVESHDTNFVLLVAPCIETEGKEDYI